MKSYIVLHHSGVAGKNNLDYIRKDHIKKYGRPFYNIMIDKGGEVYYEHDKWNWRGSDKRSKDICVVGDFTKEVPTQPQLKSLYLELKKLNARYTFKSTTTHRKAPKLGLSATATACPGSLRIHYEAYKESMTPTSEQITRAKVYSDYKKGKFNPIKSWFSSKTIWFNVIVTVAGLVLLVGDYISTAEVVTAIGVINIILRFLTSKGIDYKIK